MSAPKYEVGQLVRVSENRGAYQNAPLGPYTIVSVLPQDDYGRRSYRVAAKEGSQVRVVSEWLLVDAVNRIENNAPEPLGVADDLPTVLLRNVNGFSRSGFKRS